MSTPSEQSQDARHEACRRNLRQIAEEAEASLKANRALVREFREIAASNCSVEELRNQLPLGFLLALARPSLRPAPAQPPARPKRPTRFRKSALAPSIIRQPTRELRALLKDPAAAEHRYAKGIGGIAGYNSLLEVARIAWESLRKDWMTRPTEIWRLVNLSNEPAPACEHDYLVFLNRRLLPALRKEFPQRFPPDAQEATDPWHGAEERVAMFTILAELLSVDQASNESPPAKGPKAKSRRGGRPRIKGREELARSEFVRAWEIAKERGVSQKEFCSERGKTIKYLNAAKNWDTQRRKRTSD
jgi:hypothetical protein